MSGNPSRGTRGNRGQRGPRGSSRGSLPRGSSPARSVSGFSGTSGGEGNIGGGPPDRGRGHGTVRGNPPRGNPPGGTFRPPVAAGPIFAPGSQAVVDTRLSTSNALVAAFNKLKIGPEMPLRPGFGTGGRPVLLRANFFALKFDKDREIYDYEVKISPKGDDLSGPCKARIFELLESSSAVAPYTDYLAHDRSKRLISAKLLPQPLKLSIQFFEREETGPSQGAKTYAVEVVFQRALQTSEITPYLQGKDRDYDIQPLVSALNIVLQKHALASGAVPVGQNKYYFPSSERGPLGPGLEARRGYFMSVRPTLGTLMVNINTVHGAFYTSDISGNLAAVMQNIRRQVNFIPPGLFTELFTKLRIFTKYRGYIKKHTIFRILREPPGKIMFYDDKRKKKISVKEYFEEEYVRGKKTIGPLRSANDANFPCIDVGVPGKPNFIPPELCEVLPDQPFRNKLNETATANMIKVACNPPAANAGYITDEGLPLLGLAASRTSNTTLENFGISVAETMTVVPARILPPPRILYGTGRPNVRDGGWNILDVKFQKGATIKSWGVLVLNEGRPGEFQGPQDPALPAFLQTFMAKCRSSGMAVPQGAPRIMGARLPSPRDDPGRRKALEDIKKVIVGNLDKANKPSFILVLLSGRDNFIYPGLKKLCDIDLGLHTVCMLLNKASKPQGQDQYFSNVALKVNSKLGGINHTLDPQALTWVNSKKTMFVGIDVTHPSPTSLKGSPSIAAVVASADTKLAQYPVSLRLQANRNVKKDAEEMVQDLTAMLVERLVFFKANEKALPERVIIYRDGVSEGQYKLILQKELPQILKAFEKAGCKPRPKLSIVVCGKRHNARFPATALDHIVQRTGNTLPGTVVDNGVTDVYNFDFYLQAHNGLQGTVRPTHYVVIYDENNLSADQVQTGVHNTSYMYARATKAVSLVPPAYYADLACERARSYLSSLLDAGDNQSAPSQAQPATEAERRLAVYETAVKMWGNGIHQDLRNSMFYI